MNLDLQQAPVYLLHSAAPTHLRQDTCSDVLRGDTFTEDSANPSETVGLEFQFWVTRSFSVLDIK